MVSSEDSDRGRHEDATIEVFSGSKGVDYADNIYINRKIWLALSKGRQNSSQVDDVVSFGLLNKSSVPSLVGDIELLVLTREVKALLAYIARDNVLSPKLITEGIDERDSNLSLASC